MIALAEKKIAMALQTSDYDELIDIATKALREAPKTLIKSRKKLIWARSHAYQRKGLRHLALKDARMALKLDPDDIASYFRTAVVLIEEGRLTQARDCLDAADRLTTKLDSALRQSWLERLKKQRQKLTSLLPCHINRLPIEILIAIAQCLDVGERLAMSQTCKTWRDVTLTPCLWKELIINIKASPKTATNLTTKQAMMWLDHIYTCAKRSGHTLQVVRFGGPFPDLLIMPVLSILRLSAPSLVTIELPAIDQERCYRLLYRFCPNLTSLNVRHLRPIQVDANKRPQAVALPLPHIEDTPQCSETPFLLEKFVGDPNTQHPGLAKHMGHIRVVDTYNPFTASSYRPTSIEEHKRTPIEYQHKDFWSSLADGLEEWHVGADWPSAEILANVAGQERTLHPTERTLPLRMTFSKLVILEGFRLDRNLVFEFPHLRQLLHLHVGNDGDRYFWSAEFARILSTSPLLEKIDVKLHAGVTFPDNWNLVLRRLKHLKELSLDIFADPAIVLMLLLPRATEGPSGERKVDFPLPKLQRLTLKGCLADAMAFAKVLAIRKRLSDGVSLFEAQAFASHRLEPVQDHKRSSQSSPFHRGNLGPARPSLTEKEQKPALRVQNSEECRSLETLELTDLREMPEECEKMLREIVPNVVLKYAPL